MWSEEGGPALRCWANSTDSLSCCMGWEGKELELPTLCKDADMEGYTEPILPGYQAPSQQTLHPLYPFLKWNWFMVCHLKLQQSWTNTMSLVNSHNFTKWTFPGGQLRTIRQEEAQLRWLCLVITKEKQWFVISHTTISRSRQIFKKEKKIQQP